MRQWGMEDLDAEPAAFENLFAFGVFCRVGRDRYASKAWVFDLSHPRAREELAAIGRGDGLFGGRHPGAFDGSTFLGMLTFESIADEREAREAIGMFPIHFAALNAWGCGPLDGLPFSLGLERPAKAALEALLERVALGLHSPDSAASERASKPRL
jgi:hypothetical protein